MNTAKRIFVIDDSESYQKLITAHLTQLGFEVLSFFGVTDCLDHQKPDVILLDQNLSNGQMGTDYIKLLKSKMPSVPIVFISVDGDLGIVTKAKKLGAFDYIVKNEAAFVRLRTVLDIILSNSGRLKKQRLLLRAIVIGVVAITVMLAVWFLSH